MSKAKLLFDLIMYVNTKRSFTAQDVADEFGVSIRTAHRYLADIDEMGVPLYTEPGRGGGYRVLNNRTLPPIVFDEHEAFAIFFAFQSLRNYPSLPFNININSVSRKLYASLPADSRYKADRLGSVLAFWHPAKTVPSPYLSLIIEAAAEQRVLQIEYVSKNENTRREVEPAGVYAYGGFWYMPALDRVSGETRLFRTDRIAALEGTSETFVRQLRLDDWLQRLAVSEPKDPVRLYAELNREGVRQCRSQPWLEPYLVMTGPEHGHVDVEIDRSELPFASDFFFRLGTSAKVIEPREAIEYIRREARERLRHYS